MKTTCAAILGLLFAIAPFAPAQEEEPTPKLSLRASDSDVAAEPSVSVSTDRSTDYPKPGTPLATPRPKASPTPATKTTPAPRATATPRPAPAAPAATPRPAPAGKPEAIVRELENRWLAAIKAQDTATVDALVADNYIGVSATGRFMNKAALLAEMKKNKNTYDTTRNSGLTVRVHGDAAVVVGTTRQVGKDATGKAFDNSYRWTDTWAFRNGTWQCVASQSIQVAR
ncbi:hypothetical protein BH20VER2_BH20VER2_05440 [soil metagenome]|nr:DUF4440 domain-containing protein [Chthoniobacterales bacterium]